MSDDYLIEQSGEPWVPEPLDDERPVAEAIECFCGTIWFPDQEDSCPSCGREESEQHLTDEEFV